MSSRNDSFRHKLIRACAVVGLVLVIAKTSSTPIVAQEVLEPSWRQGVSRWTGDGYTNSAETPKVDLTPPRVSEAPYTVPVDPARLPATSGLSISGSAPATNPYLFLPPSDESTSLELILPSDGNQTEAEDRGSPALATPDYILPPLGEEPPLGGTKPLVSQEPMDRMNVDGAILPPRVENTLAEPAAQDSALADALDPPEVLKELPTAAETLETEESAPEAISEQLGIESALEPGPLESEVTRWYHYPRRWMRGWDSHAEFGLDGSTGNARTLAIQTGVEMKRQTDEHTLALDVDYRQASNRSVTTEDNGRLNLDYDRLLLDTSWSGFGKFGMEWDKFKAFDLRLNMNGGVGYFWVRRDDASFVTRFGAGASREIGAPDDSWTPEAVFGGEAERQLTSRQKIKAKVDYFPAWEDFNNYRMVSDVAWEILLDGSDNLSLKLAATDRYDSTPQGAKKNDLYYSLLLLYKF